VANQKSQEEYYRWLEYRWTAPDIDWQEGEIITVGVDTGSVSTQAVVMVDGKLYAYSSMRTGANSPESAQRAIDWALEGTGMSLQQIHYIVGTGYGRVNVPAANRTITEIACHSLGAHFIYGNSVRTILDIGGQDAKAIICDGKGRVTNFLMNDKCAAGTGRGMEVFAELVRVPIEQVGERSLQVDEELPTVSSTCVVFAKSEALTLLRQGWNVNAVLAAYIAAMAHRTVELLQRLGVEKELVFTGGLSKNTGLIKRVEEEVGLKALETRLDPQIAGGIGAALFAKALVEKSRKEVAT